MRGPNTRGGGGREEGGFLCKNEVQKVPLYIRFVPSEKVGSLQEACSKTKTHVHMKPRQRSARVNELSWSSQEVGSYYAHCAVGQLKLFGCFF